MKFILTLNSSGVANAADREWQADSAMCWTGYCLGKRWNTWSLPNIHLSGCEHNVILASGLMQISMEENRNPADGNAVQNSVRLLPRVNVCN